MILDNLKIVEDNISKACQRAGRKREEITLIAVSKTKPIEMIEEVLEAGINDFGENKVQELVRKYEQLNEDLKSDINWHMIGHLQRNKVKHTVDKVQLIHSVDSLRLAKQIEKEAKKKNIKSDILIEVNIANDPNKFGFNEKEVCNAIEKISNFNNINIKGLMTIAPYVDNPEDNRKFFRRIKQLSVDIDSKNIDNVGMDILSMGMSGDYEVAIEEGATIVRIGSSIFGDRNYTINR